MLDFKGGWMEYAGRKWFYSYRRIFDICDEAKVRSVTGKMLSQYAELTKNWDATANSEWVCRTYLSTKMILNATVITNALDYSSEVGLRLANPYFEYYAVLSLLRALVYTMPGEKWSDGELMKISHSKAINVSFNWIARFDKDTAQRLQRLTQQLKAQREVVSYKAPASGDSILDTEYDLYELLIILAEMAQFNSELLEASVKKNASVESFVVNHEHMAQVSRYEIEGYSFADPEDDHRLDYISRRQSYPINLALSMTEGQAEEFIGAWDGEEEGMFHNGSPANWQEIFDIP